ncbi:MAG: hypothetical protein WHT08_03765 [Bryobacteraceae bacterium]|jgi:hypothetical protein
MTRRSWILWPAAALCLRAADKESVRGRLRLDSSRKPAILTGDGRVVELEADEDSEAVLRDPRLKDEEFEVLGRFRTPSLFAVDPIHERALFVWRGGKRLVVTYWCDVCSIRAWRPGRCQCCQEEMRVDLRDPSLGEMELK